MSQPKDKENKIFEQFMELYSQVRTKEGTGDASLDVLLQTVEPPFAKLIQSLAMPHWFDEKIIAAFSDTDLANRTSEISEEVMKLPFVRAHSQGYTYHDLVRETLRRYSARNDPSWFRDLSRRFAAFFKNHFANNGVEESEWEKVYHTLAFNELAGFREFDTLFLAARRNRRFTVCETVVDMAAEQQDLLSHKGKLQLRYYQGMLAFYLHRWEEAEIILNELHAEELPAYLSDRAQLYRGRTFEKKGMWEKAEQAYKAYLDSANNSDINRELSARFHQRLAETYLSQGDLKKAEDQVHDSLAINKGTTDHFGEALNYGTLGKIYAKLHDLSRAQKAFNKSLMILDQAGSKFDKAIIFIDMAALYSDFGRLEEATKYYQKAREIKVDAGDNYGLAFINTNIGNLYLKNLNTEVALNYFHTALKVFKNLKDGINSAKILRNIALTYERSNDLAAALDNMRLAVQELPSKSQLKPVYQKEIHRLEKRLKHAQRSLRSKIGRSLAIIVAIILFVLFIFVLF